MRAMLGVLALVVFAGYTVAWFIVALASDPTWWWFVPVYGDIKIFGESLWWGLFHVGVLPAAIVAGALFEA